MGVLVFLMARVSLRLRHRKANGMLMGRHFCNTVILLIALQSGPIKVFDFLMISFFFCLFCQFIFIFPYFTVALGLNIGVKLFNHGLYRNRKQETLLA